MNDNSSPDYKSLYQREAELRRQAEERTQQAEEQNRHYTQGTTLLEFLETCHNSMSRPLRVRTPARSTQGKIPPPTGKCCPTRLLPWTNCTAAQQEIYDSVCDYLQPTAENAPRVFSAIGGLEAFGMQLRTTLSSERDLESYERFAVEDHVCKIITELCKIPQARQRFQLGDGIEFDNHANSLDENTVEEDHPSGSQRARPDQFCIHRVDNVRTLLMTVEYKPPHKLTVENLRVGLRPMNFWEEVVQPQTIPTEEAQKLKYNAEQISGSVLAQEYHVMIQEGLEYSYVTIGLALVLLRIPYEDPSTLYYHRCEPNIEVDPDDDQSFRQPRTAIARVLCLTLMSFLSPIRDLAWRNRAKAQLNIWETSFAHVRSKIPNQELQKPPPDSQYTSSEHTSPKETSSEWLPSSSPLPSPTPKGRTQTQSGCAPSQATFHVETDSSDSDSNQAGPRPRRKRNLSQITSSPQGQQSSRSRSTRYDQGASPQQHTAQFCTQRCLLGLQQGGTLDDHCPNMVLHRQRQDDNRHCVTAADLVRQLKQQLDQDLDHDCTPFGGCGGYGAPFKITSTRYGYTVVGKGTTGRLWPEVSREAEVYRILRKAQGSAVPVFLGAIDLDMIYFLHGAGEIRHMLLMAWGGESVSRRLEQSAEPELHVEIRRSRKEIESLGVVHGDFRADNVLWNAELRRILIIDFHRSKLHHELKTKHPRKRRLCETQTPERERKRIQVV